MKAVKMFVGMMACLVVLAGQAWAVSSPEITLTFEEQNALVVYASDYGVTFDKWQGIIANSDGSDHDIIGFQLTYTTPFSSVIVGADPVINFATPYSLLSFDYALSGTGAFSANKLGGGILSGTLSSGASTFTADKSWANVLLSSITFDLGENTMFFVDNIKITSTPVPGAAILLGSGLLGLVGLRRREII